MKSHRKAIWQGTFVTGERTELVKTGKHVRPRQWAQDGAPCEGAPSCRADTIAAGRGDGTVPIGPSHYGGVGTSAAVTLAKDRGPVIGLSAAAMAEWLRRWTWNPMGSPRAGSNPARCGLVGLLFFFAIFRFHSLYIVSLVSVPLQRQEGLSSIYPIATHLAVHIHSSSASSRSNSTKAAIGPRASF